MVIIIVFLKKELIIGLRVKSCFNCWLVVFDKMSDFIVFVKVFFWLFLKSVELIVIIFFVLLVKLKVWESDLIDGLKFFFLFVFIRVFAVFNIFVIIKFEFVRMVFFIFFGVEFIILLIWVLIKFIIFVLFL